VSSGQPRRRNLDLIEHLDDSNWLVEVNVQTGEDAHVQVLYTDQQGQDHHAELTATQAWIVADIILNFDRRGVKEFAQLLIDGVHDIAAAEEAPE